MPLPHIRHPSRMALCALFLLAVWSVGGGGSTIITTGTGTAPTMPPVTAGLVSGSSGFPAPCSGVTNSATPYVNTEAEPHIAINPANPNNLIGSWQQDRWSNGASQGTAIGVSFDAGAT